MDLSAGPALPPFGGRYRYVRLLAEGENALVVEAYDTLRSSTPEDAPPGQTAPARVALKVFHVHKAAEGRAEARTLAALALAAAPNACTGAVHAALPRVPHLRGCLGVGAGEGHVCLVLDRLAESLTARAQQGRLGPPPRRDTHLARLRKMTVQLTSALAHVHACGLVHGRVCPRHVVFDKPASVAHTSMALQLVDFSAAGGARTAVRGAPCDDKDWTYSAPEAVLSHALGPAADMWALGIVLAEAALRAPVWTPVEEADGAPTAAAAFLAACERDLGCSPPRTDADAALDGPAASGGTGAHKECRLLVQLNRVDAGLSHLVAHLLRFNPEDRLTARDAMGHPFLTALDCHLVRGGYSNSGRAAQPAPSNVARPLSAACDAAADMSSGDDAAMEDAPPLHAEQEQEQAAATETGSRRSRLHPKGRGAFGAVSPPTAAPATTGAPLPHTPAVWQPAACGVAPGQPVRQAAGLGTPDTADDRLHNGTSDGEDRGLLMLQPRLPSSDGTTTPVPPPGQGADGGASSPLPVPMCEANAFVSNLVRSLDEAQQAGPPVVGGRFSHRLLRSPPKPNADTRAAASAAAPPPPPAQQQAPVAVEDTPKREVTTAQVEMPLDGGVAATSAAATTSGDAPGEASQRPRRASMPVLSKRPQASLSEPAASLADAGATLNTGRGSSRRMTVGHAPSPVRAAKKAKLAHQAPASAPGKRGDLCVAVPPHLKPSSGKRERKSAAPWWLVNGQ